MAQPAFVASALAFPAMLSRRVRCLGWVAALLFSLPGLALAAEPADDAPVAAPPVETDKPAAEPAPEDRDPRATDPAAGHSAHGEVFNEGPRQKAYLMGGTGEVHFEITTDKPEVQAFFNQGIGQLHGFWYFEAERTFRHAASIDPDCAMLYWGMAMANWDNAKRAKGFIEEAVKRKDKASRRERMWIEGAAAFQQGKGEAKDRWRAFIRSLEAIQYEFPNDTEARAFLAWAIWQADRKGLPFSSHVALDSLIQTVLDENPMHPVHHYRIHLWDYEKPDRALASSALCGQSSPNIAHMWHMPGHIYWRVKRYHDSAWQQEASARVDHAHMVRDRVMPYRIHNYAHNNEWLTRSLSHVGRAADALSLAKNMTELPRHPQFNKLTNRGSGAYYGRLRLYEILSLYEMWEQVLELADTPYLEAHRDDDVAQQAKRLRLIGTAHFALGQLDAGREQLAAAQQKLAEAKEQRQKDIAQAETQATEEKKSQKDIDKAKTAAERKHTNTVQRWQTAIDELSAWQAAAEGNHAEALKLAQKVSDLPKVHLARFQLAAGEHDKAIATAKGAKSAGVNEVYPAATYVDVLYQAGKTDQAKKELESLRQLASALDTDLRIYQRVAVAAKDLLGIEGDWRLPREMPTDTGTRPDLASLGPFRWHPSQAPSFSLPRANGQTLSLADYRGKPVIVIFYLGYGCLHCAQQLQKFGPLTEQFRDAGIELVAISTDNVEQLKHTVEQYRAESKDKETGFPFPLAADSEYQAFKAFRAFDDFEDAPLHGTFLIDGAGRIRWQDISYEPFMEAEFLLEEAQRLLKQEVTIEPAAEISQR